MENKPESTSIQQDTLKISGESRWERGSLALILQWSIGLQTK